MLFIEGGGVNDQNFCSSTLVKRVLCPSGKARPALTTTVLYLVLTAESAPKTTSAETPKHR